MAQYEDCIIFLLAKAYQKAHAFCFDNLHAHQETFEKCSILVRIKEGENFNHPREID